MIKTDIEIHEANVFLHACGAVMAPETRDEFYDRVQATRLHGNAKQLTEAVWIQMVFLLHKEIMKRPEVDEALKQNLAKQAELLQ